MPELCRQCAARYDDTLARCPDCGLPNSDQKKQNSLRWKTDYGAAADVTKQAAGHQAAIKKIQDTIPQFRPYTTGGQEKATTSALNQYAELVDTSTRDNMHSEMVMVGNMLDSGAYSLVEGTVVDWKGKALSQDDFFTDVPHCGYCSIMLQCLGLPLSEPTKGRFNKATQHNYPIPKKIQEDPQVIARFLGGSPSAFGAIKKVINSYINSPPGSWVLKIGDACYNDSHMTNRGDLLIVSWDEVKRKLLPQIWDVIRKGMYAVTK